MPSRDARCYLFWNDPATGINVPYSGRRVTPYGELRADDLPADLRFVEVPTAFYQCSPAAGGRLQNLLRRAYPKAGERIECCSAVELGADAAMLAEESSEAVWQGVLELEQAGDDRPTFDMVTSSATLALAQLATRCNKWERRIDHEHERDRDRVDAAANAIADHFDLWEWSDHMASKMKMIESHRRLQNALADVADLIDAAERAGVVVEALREVERDPMPDFFNERMDQALREAGAVRVMVARAALSESGGEAATAEPTEAVSPTQAMVHNGEQPAAAAPLDDLQPATFFKTAFDLEPDTLRKRCDYGKGKLVGEQRDGKWWYSESSVRNHYAAQVYTAELRQQRRIARPANARAADNGGVLRRKPAESDGKGRRAG